MMCNELNTLINNIHSQRTLEWVRTKLASQAIVIAENDAEAVRKTFASLPELQRLVNSMSVGTGGKRGPLRADLSKVHNVIHRMLSTLESYGSKKDV